jgi:hypothetical protein
VNGGEVKNKFRKARIEMDDAQRKQSGKKNFPEEQLALRNRKRK